MDLEIGEIDSTQAAAGLGGIVTGFVSLIVSSQVDTGLIFKVLTFGVACVVGYLVCYKIFTK